MTANEPWSLLIFCINKFYLLNKKNYTVASLCAGYPHSWLMIIHHIFFIFCILPKRDRNKPGMIFIHSDTFTLISNAPHILLWLSRVAAFFHNHNQYDILIWLWADMGQPSGRKLFKAVQTIMDPVFWNCFFSSLLLMLFCAVVGIKRFSSIFQIETQFTLQDALPSEWNHLIFDQYLIQRICILDIINNTNSWIVQNNLGSIDEAQIINRKWKKNKNEIQTACGLLSKFMRFCAWTNLFYSQTVIFIDFIHTNRKLSKFGFLSIWVAMPSVSVSLSSLRTENGVDVNHFIDFILPFWIFLTFDLLTSYW